MSMYIWATVNIWIYLVYSSKSSILAECIIVFQVLACKQMLSFFEESALSSSKPQLNFKNKKCIEHYSPFTKILAVAVAHMPFKSKSPISLLFVSLLSADIFFCWLQAFVVHGLCFFLLAPDYCFFSCIFVFLVLLIRSDINILVVSFLGCSVVGNCHIMLWDFVAWCYITF